MWIPSIGHYLCCPPQEFRSFATGGLVLLAGMAVLGLAGCTESGTPETSDDPSVVAAYQGGEITREEFDAYQAPVIDDDPQVAKMREEDWRVTNVKELVFREALIASGTVPDAAVEQASQQGIAEILTNAMNWELKWNQVPVSMDEIRAEYDAHPETYVEPEKRQLQYIFLRAEVEEMTLEERAAVRARIEEIREEVLSGADFSEMARLHSQSSTATTGGFYTVSIEHDIFPTFFHGINSLEIGEISEVIDTPTGYHVAKLVSIIPGFVREFETQVDHAKQMVTRAKLLDLREQFIEEFGPKFGLVRNYEALDDPFIPEDTKLITIGNWSYHLNQLARDLSDHYVVHLYTGHFPRIYEHLDQVTIDALIYREAESRKIHERPEIAQQIEEIRRQARYRLELDARAKAYVADLPEENIREFFDQNEQRFQTLRAFDLDVILLKEEEYEETLWQTFKRAEGLVEELRAGADFEETARQHSRHFSVSNGGHLKTLTSYGIAYQLQPKPAYTGMINDLGIGDISEPMVAECYDPKRLVYLQTGVLITKMIGIHESRRRTYDESKAKVAESYQRRNSQKILADLKAGVLESADLQVYFDHLPAL